MKTCFCPLLLVRKTCGPTANPRRILLHLPPHMGMASPAINHPFADGNKRTGFLATEGFLLLNGYELNVTQEDVYNTFNNMAAGELSEADLATWIRSHLSPATDETNEES